jgi:hypothetical protein
MKQIAKFFMDHGLTIMLMGFVLFFVSFLMILFAGRYYNYYMLQVARGGAVLGLCMYVAGRVAVYFQKKRKKQPNYTDYSDEL